MRRGALSVVLTFTMKDEFTFEPDLIYIIIMPQLVKEQIFDNHKGCGVMVEALEVMVEYLIRQVSIPMATKFIHNLSGLV